MFIRHDWGSLPHGRTSFRWA